MKRPISDQAGTDADDSMELSLEDTLAQKMRGIAVTSRVPVAGYNPYDALAAGKRRAKKPTDLRKLSEWIRLHREINELKKNER
jgi:hypothetical protein